MGQIVVIIKQFVQNADSLPPGQLEIEINRLELEFRNRCNLAITQLKTSKASKTISHKVTAQTNKNRRDNAEFYGDELPSLEVLLKKYFADSRVQDTYQRIINLASSDAVIGGNELSELTKFMITSNLLQSCHRSEILGKFTRAAVAKAQEKPLTYFPYEMADEREFDDPDIQREIRNNFGYRYNKYIIVK